eukprot:4542571-Alexandrium_andersonii.AAC.1
MAAHVLLVRNTRIIWPQSRSRSIGRMPSVVRNRHGHERPGAGPGPTGSGTRCARAAWLGRGWGGSASSGSARAGSTALGG